ncbi:glutamyl-tRNA(Gln) amidotransferase subunit C, mitochondrial [Rhynchophorus ferrugineus]|uniref:glutamyl-tRNA(Gln) amidotransferase subunit C, mitochondrial n=1 Tax=Rhynchophorus ferrugineus TaxID=354439 RepID=UPI003FCE0EC3
MNRLPCYFLPRVRYFCVVRKSVGKVLLAKLVPKNSISSSLDRSKLPERTTIDADTIALLERLSLVDCANKQGIATLEAAIEFADQIHQVDTVGVEPLITVLEDFHLILREDQVVQDCTKVETLSNASITEEDYFVAPPGNIPLEPREDLLFEKDN